MSSILFVCGGARVRGESLQFGVELQPPQRVVPHPFERAGHVLEPLAVGAVVAAAAVGPDADGAGVIRARRCSETAPNVTSGMAPAIAPACCSSSQISRRISRRLGDAIAATPGHRPRPIF